MPNVLPALLLLILTCSAVGCLNALRDAATRSDSHTQQTQQQLDRIEKELKEMRADLKKYFEDTQADYVVMGEALVDLSGDLKTLDDSVEALKRAQELAGELSIEEKASMNAVDLARKNFRTNLETLAAKHPNAPPPPPGV